MILKKWNSVQIVTSRNKIQDYLLNLREKDVDNFSKYLQLSALSNDTKLSKIKKLIAYLSSNPEYYLYLFDSLSLPVLFDIFDGKEDELGFDDFAPDCVADAIQIGAMIGLFQVKDKGKTCQLALAEDAKGIVDSIRKVDSKKVYEQLEDLGKRPEQRKFLKNFL